MVNWVLAVAEKAIVFQVDEKDTVLNLFRLID